MKKVIYLIALFPTLCIAQDVAYSNKGLVSGKFWKYEDGALTMSVKGKGNVIIHSIDSVSFSKFRKPNRPYYDALTSDGVKVIFRNGNNDLLLNSSNSVTTANVAYLNNKLLKFNKQRNFGFSTQTGGFIIASISVIVAVPEVIILGGIISAVGWVMEWTAGKYLKDGIIEY